jgi:hypothetical protein
MAKGLKTGGRHKGTRNKRTVELEVHAAGTTPLEYMLTVMRDETQPEPRRDWAAEKSAPYCHPRKNSTEHTGEGGGPIEVKWVDD